MIKRIINTKTVLASAGVIGFFSLISRIVGLLRDRMLAGEFGAGQVLDAYYAAFKIPDFLFNLLVLGALTAAFVPVVGGYLSKHKKEEANRITSAVLNMLSILMIVLSGSAFIFASQLVDVVAPGFAGETRELTLILTRIMLVSPIIFGISSVVSSYLNTVRRFTAFAIAPVLYNAGIIVGILWFVPAMGPVGLGYGVLLGAVLHLIVQVPALFRSGFRYRPKSSFQHPGVVRILRLAGPRVIGISAMQINIVVITAVATLLSAGTVSAYNLAFNLQSLPLGIVGISLATAVFPVLARAASQNNFSDFIGHISRVLRQMFFLIIPLSLAFILLRVPIVRLALGTGQFDFEDTFLTAAALGVFAISLFAQSAVPILSRAFYSLEDTKTPVIISIISVAINIAGAYYGSKWLGVMGLAGAFSLAAIVEFLLNTIFLRSRLGSLGDAAIIKSTAKTLFASLIGGLAILTVSRFLEPHFNLETFLSVLSFTILLLIVGGGFYLLTQWILKSQELKEVRTILKFKTK